MAILILFIQVLLSLALGHEGPSFETPSPSFIDDPGCQKLERMYPIQTINRDHSIADF
jgi:hypothetical protein